MTNHIHPLRLGMTATAAVLAFTSTPLFAQAADPAPLVTPPPVTIPAPAAAVAVPSAPVAASTAAPMINVPSVTVAPAPIATRSTPIPNPEPTQAAAPVRAERTAPARAAPQRSVAPVEAAAPAVATTAPAPVVVPLPAVAERTPVAAPAQVATTQTQTRTVVDWEATALAGLGALAALGLAGLVATRRRREEDEDVIVAETVAPATLAADPFARPIVMPEPELVPAAAVASSARPDVLDGPRTAIPAGFDTGRFGRHTQAAYAGPTSDNPFLSLKRRLKRASFLDQRERMASEGVRAPQPTAALQPATVRTTVNTGHVTTRMPRQPRPTFKPAFQG